MFHRFDQNICALVHLRERAYKQNSGTFTVVKKTCPVDELSVFTGDAGIAGSKNFRVGPEIERAYIGNADRVRGAWVSFLQSFTRYVRDRDCSRALPAQGASCQGSKKWAERVPDGVWPHGLMGISHNLKAIRPTFLPEAGQQFIRQARP